MSFRHARDRLVSLNEIGVIFRFVRSDAGRGHQNRAWSGQVASTDFPWYQMQESAPPPNREEVCGGPSPLVLGGSTLSSATGTPDYNAECAGAVGGPQMPARALVPITDPALPSTVVPAAAVANGPAPFATEIRQVAVACQCRNDI